MTGFKVCWMDVSRHLGDVMPWQRYLRAQECIGSARMELTFENSDLVAEHHQLDIPVVLGSLDSFVRLEHSQALVEG